MLPWLACCVCVLLPVQPGPRLSDAEFFQSLDLGLPGLEQVAEAARREDWTAARIAFGRYFRQRSTPRWHIQPKPPVKSAKPLSSKSKAESLLRHEWTWNKQHFNLGADIDWSSNPMNEGESKTPEWNASLNRHFHLRELADAYVATGQEKYAAEVVAQMLDWIEDCPVLEGKSGNSPYHYAWETLNTAVRAGETWPDVIYTILPSQSLTDSALCTIAKSLVEHARHLDRWPTRSGNWLTMESAACFVVGTLLCEHREAAAWRAHGIERLHRQMATDVYPDGLEIELAIGYNDWVLRNFAAVLELARLNGRESEIPADYQGQLERMYAYHVYASMPNGQVPGLNDASNSSPAKILQQGFRYFPQRQDFLWLASGGKQGRPPQETSYAFPYSGHYVMRSGWDQNARWLLLDAGPFGSGHQHEDKLQCLACAYGKPLLVEGGTYMYDQSRWRRYVLSTRGHNTIRVDDQEQNRRKDRDSFVLPLPFQPLDNTWITRKDFDYAVGRYDSGYGPDRKTKVVHTRAVLFVKPDYWVLFDALDPADGGQHDYESLFHLNAPGAEVAPDAAAVITRSADEANLHVCFAGAGPLKIDVVQGLTEEPVQGWAQGPWRPVPTAVCRWNAKGKSRLATVLYPVPPGRQSPVQTVALRPVTCQGEPADDALALEIRFVDGRHHTLLAADKSGRKRTCQGHVTEAEFYFNDGRGNEFHHP